MFWLIIKFSFINNVLHSHAFYSWMFLAESQRLPKWTTWDILKDDGFWLFWESIPNKRFWSPSMILISQILVAKAYKHINPEGRLVKALATMQDYPAICYESLFKMQCLVTSWDVTESFHTLNDCSHLLFIKAIKTEGTSVKLSCFLLVFFPAMFIPMDEHVHFNCATKASLHRKLQSWSIFEL